MTAEEKRLEEDKQKKGHWRRWGPYLSERQWGTVREDYSHNGEAWNFFPHEHARSRVYRWGEDGIAGISDNHQRLCFAMAFWNEEDPILKERYFGLAGPEGNHGEDVKEYYYYLDSTPTHSYMKCLYKYPHRRFPYEQLIEENRKRGLAQGEFELIDTGIFSENRYFDIFVEYAKAAEDDLCVRITVHNRGPEARNLHVLPTFWARNTWAWGRPGIKPVLRSVSGNTAGLEADGLSFGKRFLYAEGKSEILFTENETNQQKLFNTPNRSPYVKDGINDYIVDGRRDAVNPKREGTKAAFHYRLHLDAGQSRTLQLRLKDTASSNPFADFDAVMGQRLREADEFYQTLLPPDSAPDFSMIQRQALAGMLWSKQFYHYVVEDWLRGDPSGPVPPQERKLGRNSSWKHVYNEDILSMPDKWEYPWFAAWDLAFHCIPLALVDPEFAKKQLLLLTREWYMHPNGQIPAYEWSFDDVNPPVHALAAWRVYKMEKKRKGKGDRLFLERVFQKLLLNFTSWVNRKDASGKNIFQGGFLGLDNISVFNRNENFGGGHLDQSDATSWMAMYCLNMLTISLELARENPSYEDIASKFFEHFLYIADAINHRGEKSIPLWDEEDGFFYDNLHFPDGTHIPLRVRSMVGLIPLFAVETVEAEDFEFFADFRKRYEWFLKNRFDLCEKIASMKVPGPSGCRILAVVHPERLRRILLRLLDEKEFLGPYGIRSISKIHEEAPFVLHLDGKEHRVGYEPGESQSYLFGGNSNWRGPVWFPLNYLIIESLQKFHFYLGDNFKVECPAGSGRLLSLWEVTLELSKRLIRIFHKDPQGLRPFFGAGDFPSGDPHWKDYFLFYEYFHGDTGAGLGASHQTGWTGLVAKLIQQYCSYVDGKPVPKLTGPGPRGKGNIS